MIHDPRIEVLAAAVSREVRGWSWDAPHMEHERVHLRADAVELLADIDGVDPLRHPATVCVRLDGLADRLAGWFMIDRRGNPDMGGPSPVDKRRAAELVALLQSLAVQG
jgi:hypothetical protein